MLTQYPTPSWNTSISFPWQFLWLLKPCSLFPFHNNLIWLSKPCRLMGRKGNRVRNYFLSSDMFSRPNYWGSKTFNSRKNEFSEFSEFSEMAKFVNFPIKKPEKVCMSTNLDTFLIYNILTPYLLLRYKVPSGHPPDCTPVPLTIFNV